MSYQGRNRSRNPSQTARQEWVPRGSSSATTTVERNSPASSNFNQASTRNDNRYRPTGWPINLRRDREKERSENHVTVRKEIDPNSPQLVQEIQDKRPVNHRRQNERSGNHVAVRKATDPNLPQLVQEIQDKLIKNTVECMICYDMVRWSVAIWSCSSCYSIFHLNCIKKWARAPTSVDLVAEKNQGFNWRCPGCQSVQFTSSKEIQYFCYCGKRTDPPPDLYLTPDSCGELCGKPLEELGLGYGVMKDELCPHVCVLQCHPGPCTPCKAFTPPCLCPCGNKVITTRCSDRKSVLTCGQQCDKLLECGRHRCELIFHVGACDPCNVLINAPCFCKKKVEVVICGDMDVKGKVKAEDGIFSCNSTCGKKLRCGNHYCAETCHPGPCGDCEFMPNKIKSCYCGKTSLQDQRKSCLDPIPTCSDICAKFLPCQVHRCDRVCHAGSCPPCLVLVTKNAFVGQHLGEWNATKQHLKVRDSFTSLADVRRIVVDIDVVNDAALYQTLIIFARGIGIHTFAKWHVGRS
ncbi:NF-X1-type zinc finger protein NFXL1 [Hibiscus syriacus]|uniref:NF-X1-type zinc finger protein NFXL1 n=1 Tax=Hibiscus syriacus TaxID=106335 RepID=A0A6A2YQA6_HIBSY|nr:NF-X1-type zinc finger protein NFXL1 [Hibiscus syriacus]